MTATEPSGASRVLERAATRRGELVLRRSGTEFEIISNGVFLMDTRDGRSERLMVTAALARCPAATPEILICGLGVGFSLAEAVSQARVARVDVVEISAEIIGWHGTHLRHLAGPAWEDGRVHVLNVDVVAWLDRGRLRAYGPHDPRTEQAHQEYERQVAAAWQAYEARLVGSKETALAQFTETAQALDQALAEAGADEKSDEGVQP